MGLFRVILLQRLDGIYVWGDYTYEHRFAVLIIPDDSILHGIWVLNAKMSLPDELLKIFL